RLFDLANRPAKFRHPALHVADERREPVEPVAQETHPLLGVLFKLPLHRGQFPWRGRPANLDVSALHPNHGLEGANGLTQPAAVPDSVEEARVRRPLRPSRGVGYVVAICRVRRLADADREAASDPLLYCHVAAPLSTYGSLLPFYPPVRVR